jgi:hypothetical protein
MHFIHSRTPVATGTRIQYSQTYVDIPRCTACQLGHRCAALFSLVLPFVLVNLLFIFSMHRLGDLPIQRWNGDAPTLVLLAVPGFICSGIGFLLYEVYRRIRVRHFLPVQTLANRGWQVVGASTAAKPRKERRARMAFNFTVFFTTALGWPVVWWNGGLDGNEFLPELLGFFLSLATIFATGALISLTLGWIRDYLNRRT